MPKLRPPPRDHQLSCMDCTLSTKVTGPMVVPAQDFRFGNSDSCSWLAGYRPRALGDEASAKLALDVEQTLHQCIWQTGWLDLEKRVDAFHSPRYTAQERGLPAPASRHPTTGAASVAPAPEAPNLTESSFSAKGQTKPLSVPYTLLRKGSCFESSYGPLARIQTHSRSQLKYPRIKGHTADDMNPT